MARSRVTSAPSAPRHWEALHAAPAGACQALGLESYTDVKALEGPLLPFPFLLLRSFFPSSLLCLNALVPPTFAVFVLAERDEERQVPVLVVL